MNTLAYTLASSTGLSYNQKNHICSGLFEGYRVSATCVDFLSDFSFTSNYVITLHFSITNGGKSLDDTMFTELVKSSDSIKSIKIEGYMLHVKCKKGGKSEKDAVTFATIAMQEAVNFFKQKKFRSCCARCGSTDAIVNNYIHLKPLEFWGGDKRNANGVNENNFNHICLCDGCVVKKTAELRDEDKNRNSGNIIYGLLGAILVSIIGVAIMVFWGKSQIKGMLCGAIGIQCCFLYGYTKFSKGLTKIEIPLLIICTVLLEFLSYQTMYAVIVSKYCESSFLTVYHHVLISLPSSYLENTTEYWVFLGIIIIYTIFVIGLWGNNIINKIARSKILVKINNK